MTLKQFLRAGLMGVGLAMATAPSAWSQNLDVLEGTLSRDLNVSINRAVVVESETPFAELSVANPQIADIATLSDRTIYVLGKAPGRTTLTLLGAEGQLIANVEVRVTPDISEFKERLREILPGEKIEVRTANDGIVLSGTVSSVAKLDRALDLAERYAPEAVSNLMTVGGTHQVMLKVRFAEMSRSASKELSVSLGFTGSEGDVAANGFSNTFQLGNNPVTLFPPTGGAGTFTRSSNSNGIFGIGFGSSSLQAQILVEALEEKGLVRTLAEPNLTALSGQQAEFLAGGEYPIPVVDGDNGVAIEYRPFGIELSFTPTVIDEDIINLNLATAVSAIDTSVVIQNGGFSVNAFSRRASSTTVELRDGESFAIAGLLQDDFTDLVGQVPWLGDVPVIGTLFRSSEFSRRQTELVVIITAHLVSPTRGDNFVLPTDRVKLPTERQLFLNGEVSGRANRGNPRAQEVSKQDFSGSYGYVME